MCDPGLPEVSVGTDTDTDTDADTTGGLVAAADIRASDVLCGRVRACTRHRGYRAYRDLVRAHRVRYLEASSRRGEKARIAASIANEVRRQGGRFLEMTKEKDLWAVVSPDKVRDKVSHALRVAADRCQMPPNKPRRKPRRNRSVSSSRASMRKFGTNASQYFAAEDDDDDDDDEEEEGDAFEPLDPKTETVYDEFVPKL
jgi:hypothetical protein